MDLEANDGFDRLPSLLWLAVSGRLEIMTKTLLELGADPSVECIVDQESILGIAAGRPDYTVILKLLLGHGAKVKGSMRSKKRR